MPGWLTAALEGAREGLSIFLARRDVRVRRRLARDMASEHPAALSDSDLKWAYEHGGVRTRRILAHYMQHRGFL